MKTRNILLSAVLVLAAALSMTACATDPIEDPSGDGMRTVEAFEVTGDDGRPAIEVPDMSPELDGTVSLDDSPCGCDTEECVDQYMRDNFECGVCVIFQCSDDRRVGGCVACN